MKPNMNMPDKLIRVLIAVAFAALYFTSTVSGNLGLILLIIGAILLSTVFINFCPLYHFMGISTKKKKEESTEK
ncbi:MAG: hypothetical protein ABS68_05740 [Niastella sp. SCN 39-18]|nr:DUF2892 domain-containing protein [Sphingobacteriales bacterium]ODT53392.1 MAG: hypothetical protein ABS68_05740 [Niastella sp. SCN 39-18]OJW07691.1 MAG: hypothetical protein BGO53_04135 [Sphingobacteriales bacterium 39-19]